MHEQLDSIPELKKKWGVSPEFNKWYRDTQVAIERIFGENTRHIKDFNRISFSPIAFSTNMPDHIFERNYRDGLDEAVSILQSLIDEIDQYWDEKQSAIVNECLPIIERICNRFHLVARQMRLRHNSRNTLNVEDEYDVQDLLHVLLIQYFDDIRPEEWTPSYAGSSSRMDFLLKQEQVVIEVKKTRNLLGAKEIGEQLIIDIEKYRAHPDCLRLICFVYDPEGRIANPRGIENDLNGDRDGLTVEVIIRP